jgi:hypothetical protein
MEIKLMTGAQRAGETPGNDLQPIYIWYLDALRAEFPKEKWGFVSRVAAGLMSTSPYEAVRPKKTPDFLKGVLLPVTFREVNF